MSEFIIPRPGDADWPAWNARLQAGQDALVAENALPNVPIAFDPKAFERAMAPLNSTYANVFNRMEVVYGKAYFTHNGVEYVADLDKGVTAD